MKKISKKRNSANDLYDFYQYPDSLIPYKGSQLTTGINDLLEEEKFSKILDIILRHKINFEIEVWQFSRDHDDLFTLIASNTMEEQFVKVENIKYDFFFDDLTVIKKGKLICLPIEQNLY